MISWAEEFAFCLVQPSLPLDIPSEENTGSLCRAVTAPTPSPALPPGDKLGQPVGSLLPATSAICLGWGEAGKHLASGAGENLNQVRFGGTG